MLMFVSCSQTRSGSALWEGWRMEGSRVRRGGLTLLICLFGTASSWAAPTRFETSPKQLAFASLPELETLPEPYQEKMRVVLKKPALHVRGPVETFRCEPPLYYWLLDHP